MPSDNIYTPDSFKINKEKSSLSKVLLFVSKYKFIFVGLFGLILILALVLITSLINNSSTIQSKNLSSETINDSSTKVYYSEMTFSTKTQSFDPVKFFTSDIQNRNITNLSSVTPAPVWKKLVDINNYQGATSADYNIIDNGTKIVYEIRYLTLSTLYVTDSDGSNNTKIMEVKNFPGGSFMGYDFKNNFAYYSEHDSLKDTYTITKIGKSNGKSTEIYTFGNFDNNIFSSSNEKIYINDKTSIKEYDLESGSIKEIFNINSLSPNIVNSARQMTIFMSSDADMVINIFTKNNVETSKKYLMNLNDYTISSIAEDINLDILNIDPLIRNKKYLVLKSQSMSIPIEKNQRNKGSYSANVCLWDIKNKILIPFFNCDRDKDGKLQRKAINDEVTILDIFE